MERKARKQAILRCTVEHAYSINVMAFQAGDLPFSYDPDYIDRVVNNLTDEGKTLISALAKEIEKSF